MSEYITTVAQAVLGVASMNQDDAAVVAFVSTPRYVILSAGAAVRFSYRLKPTAGCTRGIAHGLHTRIPTLMLFTPLSVVLLQAIAQPDGTVSMSNTITAELSSEVREVHFIKTQPCALDGDVQPHSVVLTASLGASAVNALAASVRTVYSPALLGGGSAAGMPGPASSALAALSRALGDGSTSAVTDYSTGGDAGPILSEWRRWDGAAASGGPAAHFAGALEPGARAFEVAAQSDDASALGSAVRAATAAVDKAWRAPGGPKEQLPQERMQGMLSRTGQELVAISAALLVKQQPLSLSCGAAAAAGMLRDVLAAAKDWAATCTEMTQLWWPAEPSHPWQGGPLEQPAVNAWIKHVETALACRSAADEAEVLAPGLRARLLAVFQVGAPSCPATTHSALWDSVSTRGQQTWAAVCSAYSQAFAPCESTLIPAVQRKLTGLSTLPPAAALASVSQWRGLLSRPGIAATLREEAAAVLGMLETELGAVHDEFERRCAPLAGEEALEAAMDGDEPERDGSTGLSPAIASLAWASVTRRRVENLLKDAAPALASLPGWERVSSSARDVSSAMSRWCRDVARAWAKAAKTALAQGDVAQLRGKLMSFDTDGSMRVHFSDVLALLQAESRAVKSLGYAVPAAVQKAVADAAQFRRYGELLQRVAAFYNNMGSSIIPCQKPLLLDPLLAFEALVTGEREGALAKQVSWDHPGHVASFVEQLQGAAEAVMAANRRLRAVHEGLSRAVVQLAQGDALNGRDAWRRQWDGVRDQIDKLQAAGKYTPEQMIGMREHWDAQLAKALEAAWAFGLESLNEALPDIRVGLRATAKGIAFDPPIESIRSMYYAELRQFVGLPSSLKPLSPRGEKLLQKLPLENAAALHAVYRKAEILFARLGKVAEAHAPLASLAQVDVDAAIQVGCTAAADYEDAAAAIRSRRRDVDKLPDTQRLDCVVVSLVPLKQDVQAALGSWLAGIVRVLQHRVSQGVDDLGAFLNEADELLNTRPESLEAIAQAKDAWRELDRARSERAAQLAGTQAESSMLQSLISSLAEQMRGRSVPGVDAVALQGVVATVSGLPARWDQFEVALEAFDDMLQEQRAALKARVGEQSAELARRVGQTAARWAELAPGVPTTWDKAAMAPVFEQLDKWRDTLAELEAEAETLASHSAAFNMAPPSLPELPALKVSMSARLQEWDLAREFAAGRAAMADSDWISFRAHVFDLSDFGANWHDRMREAGMADAGRSELAAAVWKEADRMRGVASALKWAKGEAFREEHWSQVFAKLGMQRGLRLDKLLVAHWLEPGVLEKLANSTAWLKELTSRAQGEVSIREALSELRAWIDTAAFGMTTYTSPASGNTLPLIKDWTEVFTELGDNQTLLASLRDSAYFKPFRDTAEVYATKLAATDGLLRSLQTVQRKWVYLEPVFSRGALPSEAGRFSRVDGEFRQLMQKLGTDARVCTLADASVYPGLADQLHSAVLALEKCQKALSDFLETKRTAMPRFYFLGDDDLLEILGHASDASAVQPHLGKLFQGIHRVRLSPDKRSVVAMLSGDGEEVPLSKPVRVHDDVTAWLGDLVTAMQDTLRALTSAAVPQASDKAMDLASFPGQVLVLAEAVHFCASVEAALAKGSGGALQQVEATVRAKLEAYATAGQQAGGVESLRAKVLVVDLVHYLDVLAQLIKAKASDAGHWAWVKQLRYYVERGDSVRVSMADSDMQYSFEYQGNPPKLVYTPLTDKCYLTLTQGIRQGFGGNPYGPAGTGKTESVKALARDLGRLVLVFCCDEGIDFHSMGRIFTGLVRCGAWGCFDEFNRITADQLSAVSQQIQVIQDAIKRGKPSVQLLGTDVAVDPHAGIYVTLNPAGKGYGGRSQLPDNLKALFRPVAMSRPDNELIAEVLLYAEGFGAAKSLAAQVVSLFTTASQLLSRQQHYDWGLRALKACLNTAGRFLAAARQEAGEALPAAKEAELLIQAVSVNTLSKLTSRDSGKFRALLGDVFPGIPVADADATVLREAVVQVMASPAFALQPNEDQVSKVLQLNEALSQRMGCVVTGPSGCGKTTLWRVLAAALEVTGTPVSTHVLNPKSMPRSRLLGELDHDTREWKDGVLTAAARVAAATTHGRRAWIVCDGDVDPEWIEALNSVLDDNRLLTLPNGERISFGPAVNFVFETHDLSAASPATISRMGMVFMSEADVDVRRLFEGWLARVPDAHRDGLREWLQSILVPAVDAARQHEAIMPTTIVGLTRAALAAAAKAKSRMGFAIAVLHAVAGCMAPAAQEQVARVVWQACGARAPAMGDLLNAGLDGSGTVSAYTVGSGMVDEPALADYAGGGYVATPALLRALAALQPVMQSGSAALVVGPAGSGKALAIRAACAVSHGVKLHALHCNAATDADDVIAVLQSVCGLYAGAGGRVYRPKDCERAVLLLRGLDLPRVDKWGTCALVAFLHQLIVHGGFFDASGEFLRLERVQIIATAAPAGTMGRHSLSSRFVAACHMVAMPQATKEESVAVVAAQAEAVLGQLGARPPAAGWAALGRAICDVVLGLAEALPADTAPHYSVFTPARASELVQRLARYPLVGSDASSWDTVLAAEARARFGSGMVSHGDEQQFESILRTALSTHLGAALPEPNAALFTSLLGGEGAERKLEHASQRDVESALHNGIATYEREETELGLVLAPQIVQRIVALDSMLASTRGHALLMGESGVGRRTAAKLLAHMYGAQWASPAVGRNYDVKAWYNDVRGALSAAAIENRPVLLWVEDHVCDALPAVLETLNAIVASGSAPGLYTPEELDSLVAPLRSELDDDTSPEAPRTPQALFFARVQRNLHVCVSLNARGSQLKRSLAANPALVSHMAPAWWTEWHESTLRVIAPAMLPDILGRSAPNAAMAAAACDAVVGVHLSMASMQLDQPGASTPPRAFTSLLRMYEAELTAQHDEVAEEASHLAGGLTKLREAAAAVDELTAEANEARAAVARKQKEADAAMSHIKDALSEASTRRLQVEQLSASLATARKETEARKADIDTELADIMPTLEAAKSAVGQIQSNNLNEIRSLKAPPAPIADVLSVVLKMLGISDTSWQSMKRFLGQRGVKDQILSFDARTLTPAARTEVKRLMDSKGSSFEPDVIKRVSVAAAPLAAWCAAIIKYSSVLENIAPLEQAATAAQAELERASASLEENERELSTLDARVQELQDEFAAKTGQAEQLKVALKRAEDTLGRASTLLSKLGDEKGRWEQREAELARALNALPLRAVFAAAAVTYLGERSEALRQEAVQRWTTLATACAARAQERDGESKASDDAGSAPVEVGQDLSPRAVLASERRILQWKSRGLPGDDLSVENAAIIAAAMRAPGAARPVFMIDPAGAALAWLIKEMAHAEGNSGPGADVVSAGDPRCINRVELAVRFGKTLVITDAAGVESALVPALRRSVTVAGGRVMLPVGERYVDCTPSFALYLATRDAGAPELRPDTAALLSVVNFSVTRAGLSGQLLSVTLQEEAPELEAQKSMLLAKEEGLKLQLADCERQLVQQLAEATGDILENTALVESLSTTKTKAADIAEALAGSEAAAAKLDQQRQVYKPLAAAGTELYFRLAGMRAVNHMYQFSLDYFMGLFRATLRQPQVSNGAGKASEPHDVAQARVRELVPALTARVVFEVGGALFKADRLLFALHIVHGARPGAFGEDEWALFTGALPLPSATPDVPAWVQADRKPAVQLILNRSRWAESLDLGEPGWQEWASGDTPEASSAGWPESGRQLSPWQRVLLVQAVRTDRTLPAVTAFVCSVLGVPSVDPPAAGLAGLASEAAGSAMAPRLLVTTAGTDPAAEVAQLASAADMSSRYDELAMGGGLGDQALALVQAGAAEGRWVVLKNVHLVIDWLARLQGLLATLDEGAVHADFRLWLTSEASPAFPALLCQRCVKATFEAPPGVKRNMLRTFEGWGAEEFGKASPVEAQLLFVLAWFNAVVQERRTYVPQGWSKAYEFSSSDLRAAVGVVHATVAGTQQADELQWPFLQGLLESAVYGGRVDNGYDARVLRCYLRSMFSPAVLASTVGGGGRSLARLPGGSLKLPDHVSYADSLAIVSNLPDHDDPGMFGLPANVQRAVQRAAASALRAGLRAVAAASSTGQGGFDRAAWVARLQPVADAWQSLTSRENVSEEAMARDEATAASSDDPVVSFAQLEVRLASTLVARVSGDLRALGAVLAGGALTPAVQALGEHLLAGNVPASWTAIWEGPDDITQWCRAVATRAGAIHHTWAPVGRGDTEASSLLASPLQLSDLFRPDTLLNALRQRAARAGAGALNTLKLVCSWQGVPGDGLPASSAVQAGQMILRGLGVSGALWEPGRGIVDAAAGSPEYTPLPNVTLAWVPDEAPEPYSGSSALTTPVYRSLDRQEVLTRLSVPLGTGNPVKWVLAGVAAVCSAE